MVVVFVKSNDTYPQGRALNMQMYRVVP